MHMYLYIYMYIYMYIYIYMHTQEPYISLVCLVYNLRPSPFLPYIALVQLNSPPEAALNWGPKSSKLLASHSDLKRNSPCKALVGRILAAVGSTCGFRSCRELAKCLFGDCACVIVMISWRASAIFWGFNLCCSVSVVFIVLRLNVKLLGEVQKSAICCTVWLPGGLLQ